MLTPTLTTTPVEALERARTRWGDDHVLFDVPAEDLALSVGGLRAAAEAWAGALDAAGVAEGDRIAVCLPGGSLWPVLQCAAAIVGATYVGVNVKYRSWEVERLLAKARPDLVIVQVDQGEASCAADLVRLARDAGVPVLETAGAAAPAGAPPRPLATARATPEGVALIQFTSGSTGSPKAVGHTHRQVMLSAHRIGEIAGYDADDVLFSALPFYHVGGAMCTGPVALVSGARTVVPPRFSVGGSLRAMIEKGATATQGHGAMFTLQIERAQAEGIVGDLRLRKGWAAAPPAVLRRIHDDLGVTGIVPAYGSSECGMAIGCYPHDPVGTRTTALGRAMPGVGVRVADPVDGTGELQIAGAGVMAGYLDDPAATRDAFTPDGWLRTGDLVRWDERGYLVFVDRRKDMLKPGGENVSAGEVEAFLLSLPHVRAAAVVGAPDDVMGEVPVAFVQVDAGGPAAREIVDACRGAIATFKVPAWVDVVADLPVLATGKTDKASLRARAVGRGATWRPEHPGTGES